MFEYRYFSASYEDFEKNADSLLFQIPNKESVVALTFFSRSSNKHYANELSVLQQKAVLAFTNQLPLLTFVSQSLPDSREMAVEVHYISRNECIRPIEFKTMEDTKYAIIHSRTNKYIVVEGVKGDVPVESSIEDQSNAIFSKVGRLLSLEDFSVSAIVRQWNYIGDIIKTDECGQHYQLFNDARADFYKQTDWPYGYPAATGIGMTGCGVIVSLIAVAQINETQVYSIENPLQTPAFAYSESLLIGRKSIPLHPKATPKFSRAKLILDENSTVCFISGTAAIRGENSMEQPNVVLQTKQTIENINSLISNENLVNHGVKERLNLTIDSLRVYVKYKTDIDAVRMEIGKAWGKIPVVYLQAEVCRPELLVEVEGVALPAGIYS